jgi:potassium efflux system protein
MLGLQLEKITLIASALSVGIGFGLQSIIQNFVSGVILLIERPVKVGDWVVVSGAEGTIRKIRVRATELVTAAGGTVIVPNSAFISSNVANRADSRMSNRVDVTLVVAGAPGAAQARDALLDIIAGCEVLRDDPPPVITLTLIGKAEWTFAIKVYTRSGTTVSAGRSALLFRMCEQTEGKDLKVTSPVPFNTGLYPY